MKSIFIHWFLVVLITLVLISFNIDELQTTIKNQDKTIRLLMMEKWGSSEDWLPHSIINGFQVVPHKETNKLLKEKPAAG